MKTFQIMALIALFIGAQWAESQAPNKFGYQALILDSSDELVVLQPIAMQISILQYDANGTPIYIERHEITTSNNGLVNFEIGTGTVQSGSASALDKVDWSDGPYFVKVETDLAGGTNYNITGTSELLSVPYANYASIASGLVNPNDAGALKITTEDGNTGYRIDTSKLPNYGSIGNNALDLSLITNSDITDGGATAEYAVALGANIRATGDAAVAIGQNLNSTVFGQTVLGLNNAPIPGNSTDFMPQDPLLIVGNGIADDETSNAMVIYKNGNTQINGNLQVTGAATNKAAYDASDKTTIDFTKSNLAYTSSSPDVFFLEGLKDGGSYTLALQGQTSGLASFSATGFEFKTKNNGVTTANTDTLYHFLVIGNKVYYNMTTGLVPDLPPRSTSTNENQ